MIAIVSETIREIVRRRFAIAALWATLGVAVLTGWGFWSLHNLHAEHGKPLSPVEIHAVAALLVVFIAFLFSFILAFAATLVASPMLSTEVESGVLLPVLARPISRAQIVVGKAIGLAVVLTLYGALAGLLEFSMVWLATGYLPPHPVAAIAALLDLSFVMLALTLALGARMQMIAGSIVAVIAFGIAWMTGVVAAFGPPYHNEVLIRVGVVSQLLLPTDAMWRVAVYQLEPAALLHAGPFGPLGPFSVIAPPPPATIVWSLVWMVVVVGLAVRSFARRDV